MILRRNPNMPIHPPNNNKLNRQILKRNTEYTKNQAND